LLDRRAGFGHQPLVIGQVVDRKEGRTEHLVADEEVAQVTAAVAASDAGATLDEWSRVFSMNCVELDLVSSSLKPPEERVDDRRVPGRAG
jgi:hypothetical protein